MKKNKMMRLASVLLVLTLLSTSVISGTFAKYTTQDSASDSARVAKWGVELQVFGNLYGDTYIDSIYRATDADDKSMTVQTKDVSKDVVAPGTKNEEGFTFSLNGQPEVAGQVKTVMKVQNIFLKEGTYGVMIPVETGVITKANFAEFADELYVAGAVSGTYEKVDAWVTGKTFYTLEDKVTTSNYYPVVFSLTGGTTEVTGETSSDDSLLAVANAIASKLSGTTVTKTTADMDGTATYTYEYTQDFDPNDNLADWDITSEKITWVWDYGNSAKVGNDADVNDKADTILGNLQGGLNVVKQDGTDYYKTPTKYTDYCLDTQFDIDITVTQVD